MNLVAFSINHRTAPVEIRERIWFSREETREGLHALKDRFFGECALFSTCNRTEVYGANPRTEISGGEVRRFLIEMKQAGDVVRPEHFEISASADAIRHLFRVAGGIDSMVVGDIQILGQVKEGFRIAKEERTLGAFLNRLMEASLHVGKRARSETSICEGAVSVSYAAVELATKIFDDLASKSVLLIGAGKTGELTTKHLVSKGVGHILIANRTRRKAETLVASLGGEIVEFDRLAHVLSKVDIAISSVQSASPIIGEKEVQQVMKMRQKNPIFLIDLGVPRNIHHEVRNIGNVFLYDLDSLGNVVDRNLGRRKDEISFVEKIIHEETEGFIAWHDSLQVGPTIHELRETIESIRSAEVEKNINRFRREDHELVQLITKRIVNKILHHPITSLKQHSENGESGKAVLDRIQTLREIFRLGEEHRQDEE